MWKSYLKISHNHPFHIVTKRPWPLLTSLSLLIILSGAIKLIHESSFKLFFIGLLRLLISIFQWWRDVIRERTFQGNHNSYINKILRWGIILFIIREIFFFAAIFWAFFHISLSPRIEIGNKWPPIIVERFDPYKTPLLNTIVLLTSGISITWAHYSLINQNKNKRIKATQLTILLGIYFTFLQYQEYRESRFSIADSVYGRIFFLLTGFHGIHVLIGTLFIIITLYRFYLNHFSNSHHFCFEARAWYWHFVDVIWLFVYTFLYWWSYYLFSIIKYI